MELIGHVKIINHQSTVETAHESPDCSVMRGRGLITLEVIAGHCHRDTLHLSRYHQMSYTRTTCCEAEHEDETDATKTGI